MQGLRDRWEQHVPAACPCTWAEIIGFRPGQTWPDPLPDCWPPAAARRLNEALGLDYSIRTETAGEASNRRDPRKKFAL